MANPTPGIDQPNRERGMDAAAFFGAQQFVARSAPGRVNLLGEHTDYNDGFMLPVATPQCTTVSVALNNNPEFEIYSSTLGSAVTFGQDGKAPEGFAQYIEGCIRLLQQRGVEIAPLRMHVTSNLPLGTGLSSSAALEVATLRAMRALLGFELDDRSLALIAQQSEIQYAGVNCGIMDQMASSLADSEHMLFLDARTLETRLLPIPAGSELIVIDSGMPRTLAASAYNVRRAECEAAARALGVAALRDVTNVAPQALALLNNDFVYRQAVVCAARLKREGGDDPAKWVETGWALALGRQPTAEEKTKALEMFTDRSDAALVKFCLLLFNLNEFIYVD